MKHNPRIIIAGTSSSVGKTTVSLGLMDLGNKLFRSLQKNRSMKQKKKGMLVIPGHIKEGS